LNGNFFHQLVGLGKPTVGFFNKIALFILSWRYAPRETRTTTRSVWFVYIFRWYSFSFSFEFSSQHCTALIRHRKVLSVRFFFCFLVRLLSTICMNERLMEKQPKTAWIAKYQTNGALAAAYIHVENWVGFWKMESRSDFARDHKIVLRSG
jgi:hypothetical protein